MTADVVNALPYMHLLSHLPIDQGMPQWIWSRTVEKPRQASPAAHQGPMRAAHRPATLGVQREIFFQRTRRSQQVSSSSSDRYPPGCVNDKNTDNKLMHFIQRAAPCSLNALPGLKK